MKHTSLILIILSFSFFYNCNKASESPSTLLEVIDQGNYIDTTNFLIACAAGGELPTFLNSTDLVNVFFYPKLYSTDFQYYELNGTTGDKENLNLYEKVNINCEPILNGFMKRYVINSSVEKWCRVSYESNDTLWFSKPILIQPSTVPTSDGSNLLTITENENPTFFWEDTNQNQNAIYFQVVVDASNRVLSATYTRDAFFTYNDWSNVLLNVSPLGAPFPLNENDIHRIIIMGVDSDNWVRTLFSGTFTGR